MRETILGDIKNDDTISAGNSTFKKFIIGYFMSSAAATLAETGIYYIKCFLIKKNRIFKE